MVRNVLCTLKIFYDVFMGGREMDQTSHTVCVCVCDMCVCGVCVCGVCVCVYVFVCCLWCVCVFVWFVCVCV